MRGVGIRVAEGIIMVRTMGRVSMDVVRTGGVGMDMMNMRGKRAVVVVAMGTRRKDMDVVDMGTEGAVEGVIKKRNMFMAVLLRKFGR